MGSLKCNMHTNWRNGNLHCCAAWRWRGHVGNVRFHVREAFSCSQNRLIAELRAIIWVLQSVRDLQFSDLVIASDHHELMEAISNLMHCLRYRCLLEQIMILHKNFNSIQSFFLSKLNSIQSKLDKVKCNQLARDIAKSVLRDRCFQSYIAMWGRLGYMRGLC